jgi:hypothetical protein
MNRQKIEKNIMKERIQAEQDAKQEQRIHTEEENREILFINAKEKLECAIRDMIKACSETDRNSAGEIHEIILETTDGYINLKGD